MKTNWKKYFIITAAICLGLQLLGALISILFSMPAQVVFEGPVLAPSEATPALVAQEFVTKGTALAPPLLLTVVYSVIFLLAKRNGPAGVTGTLLLTIIGVLFTFATLGEYTNLDRFPHMPGSIFLINLLINNIFTVGIAVMGIITLTSQLIHFTKKKSVDA
jgi:hypothetical protein